MGQVLVQLPLFVGSRRGRTHDPLSDVIWQGFRLPCHHVNANTSQNRTRSKFLCFLIGHFMNHDKGLLSDFLYRRANRQQVTGEQLTLVLEDVAQRLPYRSPPHGGALK
jgi:hypothetical protein